MQILHRPGKIHINADRLSRIPDTREECNCYYAGARPEDLPCGGCRYCVRAHHPWACFEEDVDDVVPLAIHAIVSHNDHVYLPQLAGAIQLMVN